MHCHLRALSFKPVLAFYFPTFNFAMAATVAALEVVLQHEREPAMEELRRELAAARARHLDLLNRFAMHEERAELAYDDYTDELAGMTDQNEELRAALAQARADSLSDWWAMATDAQPRRLLTWREYLEQEVAEHREREARLRDGADRLMRWAAQGGSEEDVPDEIWRAIQVMRGNDEGTDDEADDAEMAVDSAAAP